MNTCVYIPLKRVANLFEDLCNFNLDRKFEIFFLLEQEFLIGKFLFLLFEESLKRFFRKLEQRQNFPNLELPRIYAGSALASKICIIITRQRVRRKFACYCCVSTYFFFLSAGDVLYRIQLKSQWDFCISV